MINAKVTNRIPGALVVDMEPAVNIAFAEVFGNASMVIYCVFHCRKADREQLSKKIALKEFFMSENLQKVYKWLISLAFVPPTDVIKIWEDITGPEYQNIVDDIGENFNEFLCYFELKLHTSVSLVGPTEGTLDSTSTTGTNSSASPETSPTLPTTWSTEYSEAATNQND